MTAKRCSFDAKGSIKQVDGDKKACIEAIREALKDLSTPARAERSKSFFKTGEGQYGEGDVFIGVSVPDLRRVSRRYQTLSHDEVHTLLYSSIHEERLLALYILVLQFQQGDEQIKEEVYDYYLTHRKQVNNWDLVDCSASYIVGAYLFQRDRSILHEMIVSSNLWERRIAMVGTHYFIRKKDFQTTLSLAEKLLGDRHDLLHKASGWMLREVGKQDEQTLRNFLDQHAAQMPRTMLRYSIERLDSSTRQHYMKIERTGTV
ncbi:MAG: DNA alkylation repair protein [Bacteroidota bacterium]